MATSANRPKTFPARSKKSYRLEMESRTLYLLLSLMALTGVVVFYLGVETGRALRDPNAPVPLSAEIRTPGLRGVQDTGTTPRAFNQALQSEKNLIEELRKDQNQAALKTQNLLKRTDRFKMEEVLPAKSGQPGARPQAIPSKPPKTPKPAKQALARNPAPKRPATEKAIKAAASKPARAKVADDGSLYTVQVFSSRFQKNAQDLASRLKNKGFPAYVSRFQSSRNEVRYRVRVGKTTKSRALDLSERLKREALMRKPQLTKL
ncbi:MAG: SPOR domain-containing protein [bacterium]